jgi:tetratricopeptide (TPR) repeat protein
MTTDPKPSPPREPPTGTIERLYVWWIASSLLLGLLLVIVVLLGSGQLRRQALRIAEQAEAINTLRADVSLAQRRLDELTERIREISARMAAARQSEPQPSESPRPQPAPTVDREPPAANTDSERIRALLQRALRSLEGQPDELADRAAAEEALGYAVRRGQTASWPGATWARLALLASLLDRDELADGFARQALAGNEFPRAYYEMTVRRLLARGQDAAAIDLAQQLADARPRDPVAMLLLARAHRMQGNLAAANQALEPLEGVDQLSLLDRLELGRLFVALERWQALDALLSSLSDLADQPVPTLNYLRAVLAIQQDRPAEGLAILDNLLAEQSQGASRTPLALDEYALRTWRAVALLSANQLEAARAALAHTAQRPDRPEAWYWRGRVEIRAGNTEEARDFFQHALAASRQFAPAWEALGTLALNEGDLATARQNFAEALNVNPRRAATHLLLAIVHAKASRPQETAAALQTAFRLEPTLLETARQTEVITRLFSDEELRILAGLEPAPTDTTPTDIVPAE